jgi:serine/threonine protein kinase
MSTPEESYTETSNPPTVRSPYVKSIFGFSVLISADGTLKLADFGMARKVGDLTNAVSSSTDRKTLLTNKVMSRWYRAPEIFFGSNSYSYSVDIWSVGCVFGEMLLGRPLFPGRNDVETVQSFVDLLGLPSNEDFASLNQDDIFNCLKAFSAPGSLDSGPVSSIRAAFAGLRNFSTGDILCECLRYCPEQRPSVKTLLRHPYWSDLPVMGPTTCLASVKR